MTLAFWLIGVFILGTVIGSFLNVAIYRLPLEKSVLWPGSRCGKCLQPIRWYDNIPLFSFLWLRGRCRTCGATYSGRYFLIELFTGLCFVGLFQVEVAANCHQLDMKLLDPNWKARAAAINSGDDPIIDLTTWSRYDQGRLAIFAWHATLFCFLLVASVCDLDHFSIPLAVTIPGSIVGIIGASMFPWPWPYLPIDGLRHPELTTSKPWWLIVADDYRPRTGLYPWPFWGPLPRGFAPGGLLTGLATGVMGFLVGTSLLRIVRFCFGLGMGPKFMDDPDPEREKTFTWFGQRWLYWFQRVGGKTLGIGDADLVMMAGCFVGWQAVAIGVLCGIFPGLFFGILQLGLKGSREIPFGPSLALGIMFAILGWEYYGIGAYFQMAMFSGAMIAIVLSVGVAMMIAAAFLLRLLKRV